MIEKTGNDLVVIASSPQELADGQLAIIEQVKAKEKEAQEDYANACVLVSQCEDAKLNAQYAKRLKTRAEGRKRYLLKVRAALESGYVIMPNFPGNTIAVRVKREKPFDKVASSTYGHPSVPDVLPEQLPAGEGRYVDPRPLIDSLREEHTGGKGEKIVERSAWPIGYDEEIALPVDFLKPSIIQMTGAAMNKKIFDELAVTQEASMPKGDPMVIGRIVDRRNNRRISFLVAWFVDTKDI